MEYDYYVLFRSNTDAMAMDAAMRRAGVMARISPTPHDLQGRAGCGVAVLIRPDAIDAARGVIDEQQLAHFEVVRMPRQINPRRDVFS